MRNAASLQLLLFSTLWKLTAATTSSTTKVLGFFPPKSDEGSNNDLWILHCRSMFRAAILLSQQYNITFQGQYLTYDELSTDEDITVTLNHTCQKVSTSNIVGFVGPASSNEARYIASLAHRLGIIDVSYSATSPDLSTVDTGAFYRVSPSDQKTVLGIKILFQQYKWKSCIILYQNDEYGYDGMYLLSQKLSEMHIRIFETIKFDINEQTFLIDFKKTLLQSLSRIVIVWANEQSTRTMLEKALEDDLIGQDFVWILTTAVKLDYFDQRQHEKLIGILTIQPAQGDFVNATLLNEAYKIWRFHEPDTFPGIQHVSIFALFTFDATWSLILALQQLCSMRLSCLEFTNASDCYNRQFSSSEQYYNIMKTMTFSGVSGDVEFVNETPDRVRNVRFVIKNIQPLNAAGNNIDYVSVLQWDVGATKWVQFKNQSGEIVWPNRSKLVPIDHKLIQGRDLRIGIIESPPSIILRNASATYSDMIGSYKRIDMMEFDGFYKDLILYLEDKMGFTPVIMLARPTIRYDELVDGVASDLFDVVMSSIDINVKRNQIVDFSIAIMPASYRIVIRKPESLRSDYFLLLKTFLWALWLLLLIIIPYTNVLIWLVERKNEKSKDPHSLIRIIIVISYPFYSPLGTSHPHVKTNAGRFLASILFILQIVLLAIHTAGLVSFVIVQNPKLTISGIDDIKNGIIPPNRIGILVGSQIEEYYLNSISHGRKDYYPLKTPDEVYTRLVKGDIDASLWSNISTAYHINNMYCELMTVGVEFSHSFYQIPVKRGWLYTPDLNFNILSFMESEKLDRVSAKWFGRRNCSETNLFTAETKTETIRIMSQLFITIALISIISIFMHFLSIRHYLIDRVTRLCCKDAVTLPAAVTTTATQFVLIDLSTRLNDLASAMLETLCSLSQDSVYNFNKDSPFDFEELSKRTTILFVSSEVIATMDKLPEHVESVFILEDDKSRVNNEERFATGEDLIFLLADEMYRCYQKEARAYLESGDLSKAKLKEELANRIHSELKKTHQRLFARDTSANPSPSTVTRLIWLKSKFPDDVKVELVRDLFAEVVCEFSIFDDFSDCRKHLLEQAADSIFLIIHTAYEDWIVTDLQALPNVKVVGRYGLSSSENETTDDADYDDLYFQIAHDLITHYNRLGTDYSNKEDAKTAKEMFAKAHKLCQLISKFR